MYTRAMLEVVGDLFTYSPVSVCETTKVLRCVTTNGVVKANGNLVMGAGVAKDAARKFPDLPHLLGQLVDERGNHVFILDQFGVASFPTKHNWKDNSDLDLIQQSCRELLWLSKKWDYVILPRVGCGLGGLDWEQQVKPIVEKYFEDNKFIIVRSA